MRFSVTAVSEPNQLADLFARLSGLVFSEQTVRSSLQITVNLMHEVLPATQGAGVTLIREGKKLTAAHTDEVVKRVDALQYELDEGPCLSAFKDGSPYRIDSMEMEDRWPRWAPEARGMGMRSAISVPLTVPDDRRLGAVKAYSEQLAAFDEQDVRILQMFAAQAAIVLANVLSHSDAAGMSERLKSALRTRQEIAVAMGILMERDKVGEDQAFTLLRGSAHRNNVKLHRVASDLVSEVANPTPR